MPATTRTTTGSTFTIKPVRLTGSDSLTYVAVPVLTTPAPVRWTFLLFIFSIPFEAQDLGVLSGFLSPARIFGTLFFLVYLLYHNPLARRHFPPMPLPVRWFAAFLVVFFSMGYILGGGLIGNLIRLMTFAQLVVFLWLAADLLRDKRFATQVLLTFAGAITVLAGAMVSGYGGVSHDVAGRTGVLKEDLNGLATNMGIAVLIFAGLYFSSAIRRPSAKLLCAVIALLPLAAMAQTGSRGGVVAFVAGLLVFLTPYAKRRWRWGPALTGTLVVVLAGYVVTSNEHFMDRIYFSYEQGNFAGREELYPVAIEMIKERPVFGWQADVWLYEMRLGSRDGGADPHNLFLQLLLHNGLVGALPYVIALWLCGVWAWKSRGETFGFLPIALFATVLMASLSLSTTAWKTLWFALAVGVACGEGIVDTRRVRGGLLPGRVPGTSKAPAQ